MHAVACLAYAVPKPEAHVAVLEVLFSGPGLGSLDPFTRVTGPTTASACSSYPSGSA